MLKAPTGATGYIEPTYYKIKLVHGKKRAFAYGVDGWRTTTVEVEAIEDYYNAIIRPTDFIGWKGSCGPP